MATAPVVFAGETFDEGFYLIKVRWFEFKGVDATGQRQYVLCADERMVSVHSLVRCEAIKLAKEPGVRGRGRPAALPRQSFF